MPHEPERTTDAKAEWPGRRRLPVATVDYKCGTPLGLGSGDRFGGLRGGSGPFKLSVQQLEKPSELQGKRSVKRAARSRSSGAKTSMVRRGSAVRVRQRALQKPCKSRLFRFFPRRNLQELHMRGYGAVYGAFRSKRPARQIRFAARSVRQCRCTAARRRSSARAGSRRFSSYARRPEACLTETGISRPLFVA
jgi:hypothetical protein